MTDFLKGNAMDITKSQAKQWSLASMRIFSSVEEIIMEITR